MAGVKFNKKEFESKVGKLTEEMKEKISMLGTHFEGESKDGKEIELEILPNRPDLFSLHGFARAFSAFLGKKTGLVEYKVNKPEKDYEVVVASSVLDVRPYTACAIIKDMKFSDEKIKEVIDIQEKLHATLGRNRRKIAIGIYPLEKITLPIRFEARKPEEIRFVPLESKEEMNGRQILSKHPAGREYASLLNGCEKFPVFVDAAGEILSMPPVINSHKTGKVTDATKDLFIECSGFDINILKKTLNILATMFSDMGGKICQMKIEHKKGNFITPELEPEKMKLNPENVNKLLGIQLKDSEIKSCLEKMGHNYDAKTKTAEVPAWRTDILHEHDLMEDIAIAHGYENFAPEIPNISSAGEESRIEVQKRKIAEVLAGMNMLEVSSYHLTTSDDQFKKVSQKKEGLIEIKNSKTDYNLLRNNLLHCALRILGDNVDSEYPHRIFELGKIFKKDEKSETGITETERLCVALADSQTGFTEIKQTLDYLMKMLGKTCKIEPVSSPFFIEGRCGKVLVDGKEGGHIGEISAQIINHLKIKMPVAAFEIDIERLVG